MPQAAISIIQHVVEGRMYPALLPVLRCPRCPEASLSIQQGDENEQGELIRGKLVCSACGAGYSIVDGIPDFLGPWTLPDSPAQLVNRLPITAWGYERFWRPRALSLLSGEPFSLQRELALISALLAPERPGLYLDLACSIGLYARAIAQARANASGQVVGIDHALPMCTEARRVARKLGLPIEFVRARVQALPFSDAAAAGAAMGGSLNEIGDLDSCLAQLRRVLNPEGRFVCMSLARAEQTAGQALQGFLGSGGLAFWTEAALNASFARHRLRLVGQWRYGLVVFSQMLAAET